MQHRPTTPTPDRRCSLTLEGAPEVNSTVGRSLTLAGAPEVNYTVGQHLARPLAKRSCNGMRRSRSCRLNLDVIGSILVKLPIKSILRFRSVSKSWKELISDPTFIKLHSSGKSPRMLVITRPISDPTITRPDPTIGLYGFHEDGGSPNLLFQLPFNDSTSTIVTRYDCDGLVLIHSKEEICVCNPSTRETIHLPGFSRGSYERRVQYIGFGLDPSTNLYKVVRFFYHKFNYDDDDEYHQLTFQTRCEVFTLGSEFQSWRQVDDPPHGAIPIAGSASANGRIYWRTLSTDCILLSFDLRHEDFRVLLPPSKAKKWEYFIMNGGGQGVERLWYGKINLLTFTYDIWELTDETTHSWTIMHRIGFKMSTTLAIPMLVIGDGRLILLGNQDKIQQYDIVSKERKTILTMDGVTLLLPSLYRETLVSFKP